MRAPSASHQIWRLATREFAVAATALRDLLDFREARNFNARTYERSSVMPSSRNTILAPMVLPLVAVLIVLGVANAQAAGKGCTSGTVPLDVKCGIPVTTEFYSDSIFTIFGDGAG